MLALSDLRKVRIMRAIFYAVCVLFSVPALAVTGVTVEVKDGCEAILDVPRLNKAEAKIFKIMMNSKGVRRTVEFLSQDYGRGPIQTQIFPPMLVKFGKLSKAIHLGSVLPGNLGLILKRVEQLPPDGIFIQQPDLAREALKHIKELDRPYDVLSKVIGPNSFFILQDSNVEQHSKWLQTHKLIMPHFQPRKIISEYLPKIRTVAQDIVEELKRNQATEITPGELSFYFAARVAADLFLNHKLTLDEARELRPATDSIISRDKDRKTGGRKLHEFLMEKTNHEDASPLVKDLVNFQKENNLPDKWVADQLATLYFAAVETTQSLLGTSLYYMAKHRNWAETVNHEYAWFNGEEALTLNKTPRTQDFINENLRLHPPVPALQRTSNQEFVLNGYRIPANTLIYLDILGIHRNPSVWGPSANDFNPYRFAEDDKLESALIPFGAGMRACIGSYLAKMEVIIFLGEVFTQFIVDLPKQDEKLPNTYGLGTMRVSDSLKLKIYPK